MRHVFTCLLAGTALTAPLAAHATIDPAAPAAPAPAAAPPAAADEPTTDEIVVIGKGETRQVQQLSQADIAELAPGTSPLKAIAKLPGVNFQSADQFGAYEWSERLSIRGFNQNQLGFTLDGIPLGDGSYGNTNGLHVSRAISPENIAQTRVSQGSGSIGTQATNNLGGTIEFISSDPKPAFGVTLNGAYGSNDTMRGFFRLDTGELGDGGPSAYVSYGYLKTDKWRGYGQQRQNQVNAKFTAPLVGAVRLVGTFDYSDRREQDYQDMSLDMIKRLGYRWDNNSNNFAQAVLVADVGANTGYTGAAASNPAAGMTYPTPFLNPDDAYFDAAGLRKDYLASLGLETTSGPIKASIKGYYHDNHGQGIWFTPYVASPSGVPISVRTTEYDIRRKGVFGSVGGSLGSFGELTVGAWYERNDFHQARRYYALDSRTTPTRSALQFQNDPFFTQWEYRYQTDTFQYYVQDKISLGALTLDLGWKGYDVSATATPIVAGGLAAGKIKTTDWFQPHAGATFKVTNQAELFAGFTEVTRAFTAAATSGPFATTPLGFAGLGNLKPETSDTFELGGRLRSGILTASLAGYYVDFKNRLLAFANGAGIIGNIPILRNVGGVRSTGIEATAQLRLPEGFGAFMSYAYNVSKYRNNIYNGDGSLFGGVAIKDKTVVDSPRHIAAGEITYDSSMFFGRFGANYMSKRFFTYSNDQSVAARVIFDATLGVRINLPGDHKVELQVNGTNLFDKKYIATIGSNGFGNSGDNQTLLIGAPQQFFVTLKTGF
jgi:iron complex outermembrane receptor protein